MSETQVHIEIYLDLTPEIKELKNKKYLIKEFEDNDNCILFSNYLFRECIFDYENHIYETRMISEKELKTRFLKMKTEIRVSPSVEYKINSIIEIVKKYKDIYAGIKVIY